MDADTQTTGTGGNLSVVWIDDHEAWEDGYLTPTDDWDLRLRTATLPADTAPRVTKHYYANTPEGTGDQRIATRVDDNLYYVLGDHLGSTSLVVDESGAEQGYVIYDAYGQVVENTLSEGLTDRLFTGQVLDPTGLYYYNARYYDPLVGQFTQPDSLVADRLNGPFDLTSVIPKFSLFPIKSSDYLITDSWQLMMNLLWPWFLLLLLLIPLIVAVYIWMLRRKRRFAVRYSSLSLIREVLPKWSRWRQHFPFALFLLTLTSLMTAVTRPVVEVEVPLSRTTIILALDVSRSMCATDVSPNRLTVAQQAALAFIEDQPAGTRFGLVAFAGFAEIIVPPTNDKEVLQKAIRNLTTSIGTTIGSATLKSIDAIAEINPAVVPSYLNLRTEDGETGLEEEVYQPDIIVLLTDGANTQGPHPLDAAQQAADRRVRVYTIGFGTLEPGAMVCTQQQLGSDVFGNGFGGGFGGGGNFRRFLLIDEPTLQTMADITGGAYFRAENADQLLGVFHNLPAQLILQKETLEISMAFSTLGAILVTVAIVLSLIWNRFP